MIKKIWFWLNVSRLFSLPLTILSWVVIFVYSLKFNGNILNGVLALIGISLAHLATNLADDYFDYKEMLKDKNMMSTIVKNKCIYIKDGRAVLNDVLRVVIIYCSIAFVIGVILTFRSGLDVIWLAVIGGILTLSYSKFSRAGLSEIAVGTAFGPLFFEGVYYVMTGAFSFEVLVLSIAAGFFTVGVLYTHTLLDYDSDKISHKRTLCSRVGSKNKALKLLVIFYAAGFLFAAIFSYITKNIYILLTFFAVPLVITTVKAVEKYNKNPQYIPKIKWWNYPLDNWQKHLDDNTAGFYFVLYQSRNLSVIFCILLTAGILL